MNDAITELERKKSLPKAKKSNGQGSKSSSEKTSEHKAPGSDIAACDSLEGASCSHSNIGGHCKVESKLRPTHPSMLHLSLLHQNPSYLRALHQATVTARKLKAH